jgi:hypothetical protein
MGSTLFQLTEDLSEHDFPPEIVIVDIGDIIEDMHGVILSAGEQPVYGQPDSEHLSGFLFDIFNEIGYLPDGHRFIARNIADVLFTSEQYFSCAHLSPLQYQGWMVATQQIIDRFIEYRMYDSREHVHNFDYHDYHDGTLYLKRP